MASPKFYLYPGDSTAYLTSLQIVDLVENLSDLDDQPVRLVADAEPLSGGFSRAALSGGRSVRIVLENAAMSDGVLYEKLRSMQAHLERGGYVGFALDSAKAFCARANTPPGRGDTTIAHGGHLFGAWVASPALASTDFLCVQEANPTYRWEHRPVSSLSTSAVVLSEGCWYDYESAPVVVRWRDFWPILKLPASGVGRSIVTHARRLTWTLDVTLVEDTAVLGSIDALDSFVTLAGTSMVHTGAAKTIEALASANLAQRLATKTSGGSSFPSSKQ